MLIHAAMRQKWMDSSGDSCIIQQEPRWITCACVQASHWFAAPECSPESGTMRWWPWVTSYLVCSQWSYSLSGCYSITQENLKGIVHAEIKILTLFAQPHVVPNLNLTFFFSVEHKRDDFWEIFSAFFHIRTVYIYLVCQAPNRVDKWTNGWINKYISSPLNLKNRPKFMVLFTRFWLVTIFLVIATSY